MYAALKLAFFLSAKMQFQLELLEGERRKWSGDC
jgi:hypothetical protein